MYSVNRSGLEMLSRAKGNGSLSSVWLRSDYRSGGREWHSPVKLKCLECNGFECEWPEQLLPKLEWLELTLAELE